MKNFEGIDHKRVTFDKCIDKEGTITFSAILSNFLKTKTHRGHEPSMLIPPIASDH